MKGGESMESALVVSYTEKSVDFFCEMLRALPCRQIVTLPLCGDARRMLLERDFDLVIINAPLRDESGEELAREIASQGISQVILVVKNEYFDEISTTAEDYGVFTVAKPINRTFFRSVLKLAKAGQNRLRRMNAENCRLAQKIDDIRIIDRAKCLLISYFKISEQEAHRSIEKQAMDMRMTKKEVAEGILKTYEE